MTTNFGRRIWNKKNQQVQLILALIGGLFAVVAWLCFSNEAAGHGFWSVLVTAICWGTAANIESEWIDSPNQT